jgi:hypothetical protein
MFRSSLVVFTLFLSACGGGGGGDGLGGDPIVTPLDPTPPPRSLMLPEASLATRVAEAQLTNGAWAFQHKWFEPIDHAFYGYQNVTGLTGLGLFAAHLIDVGDDAVAQDTWFLPAKLTATKNYLIEWCADYVAGTPNPWGNDFAGNIPTSVSVPTFLFLAAYDDTFGLTPAETTVMHDAWIALLTARDVTHGTDPMVLSDGLFNRIQALRTSQGIPGIVGWDTAFILKALLVLPDAAYPNGVEAEIEWQVAALKALPVDTNVNYGLDGIAHTLEALNLAGDTSVNATLLAAMDTERNPDGSYTDNPEAAHQTTAYCLLALKAVESPQAAQTASYLLGTIHLGGYVYNPADNVETYEVSGEILFALLR